MCTSMECPVDEHTQMTWMVSVVAPPTSPKGKIDYDVLAITPVNTIEDTVRIDITFN